MCCKKIQRFQIVVKFDEREEIFLHEHSETSK